MRVLIIEDSPNLADAIRRQLLLAAISTDIAPTTDDAGERLTAKDYDAIILDVMLGGDDGREFCRSLRADGNTTPVLILTALGMTEDKLEAFAAGADDYLVKPFDDRELLARLNAIVRRRAGHAGGMLQVADLVLDPSRRTATRAGRPIDLRGKEFVLLEYMMLNRGKVLTKERLVDAVWQANFDRDSTIIETYISTLRRKIDRDHDVPLIHTIRGAGYKLDDEGTAG